MSLINKLKDHGERLDNGIENLDKKLDTVIGKIDENDKNQAKNHQETKDMQIAQIEQNKCLIEDAKEQHKVIEELKNKVDDLNIRLEKKDSNNEESKSPSQTSIPNDVDEETKSFTGGYYREDAKRLEFELDEGDKEIEVLEDKILAFSEMASDHNPLREEFKDENNIKDAKTERRERRKRRKEKRKKEYAKIKQQIQDAIDEIGKGFTDDNEESKDSTCCSKADIRLDEGIIEKNKQYERYNTIKRLKITGSLGEGISSDQISNISNSLKKAHEVSMFGTIFNKETFAEFMEQIKDANTVEFVLSKFEGDKRDYKPTLSKDGYKIKNLSFWMKQEGIEYVEYFAHQTNMKKTLEKVKCTIDEASDISTIDTDALFSHFDNINVTTKDVKDI